MKRLKFVLFSICMVASINYYRRQLADDQLTQSITIENNEITKKNDANIIPFFTATDKEIPSGQYWPSSEIMNASVFIKNDSYSKIAESKELLDKDTARYLGYFIDPTSQEKIYLYGTQDEIEPDDDDEDDDDSDDN